MSIHSRDTAVVVFKTRGANGLPEYRVAHIKNPNRFIEKPNYPSANHARFNREAVLSFAYGLLYAHVYTDAWLAFKEALRLQGEMPHVMIEDYPILTFDFGDVHFPATDEKRTMRRQRGGRKHLPYGHPRASENWIDVEFEES